MCYRLDGVRLPPYAFCSCGAHFPECDLEDAKVHINPKPGVRNHAWTFIHEEWISILNPVRPPSA